MITTQKTTFMRNFDDVLYWILLLLTITGNFIISVVLVPFFLVLDGITLYFSLFFIGMSFGWMFSSILHAIEKLHPKKKIIASIFIPCLAVINVGMFSILANRLIDLMQLNTLLHNPAFVGAAYVLGYVIPDAVFHLKKKRK